MNAFAGAQGVHFNDLNFTQAQNVHYNYARPLDLSQILNPLPDASHTRNRRTSPPDSQCLAGTRRDVFQQLGSWMQNGTMKQNPTQPEAEPLPPKSICWMYGSFGCGKSAIAQTMAEWYAGKGRLAASFFFFRGAGSRSTTNGFVATLSHQMATNVPGARKFIEQAIVQDAHVAHPSRALDSQLRSLVFLPLFQAIADSRAPYSDPYLIVIDGMDECEDKQGISSFIDLCIAFFSSCPSFPLRLFITSRVEEHIRTHIQAGAAVIHLFDLSHRSNRADVEYAMNVTFANARKHDRALQSLGRTWPSQGDLYILVDYCDGSFIFMSTIARFILWGSGDDDERTPDERLKLALKINPGIDSVYRDVLSRSRDLPHFLTIISTIVYLQIPLSIAALAALLGLPTYQVIRVLITLQAILRVPGWDDQPVTFFHTSLRDFLTDEARSGEFHSPPSHHTYLMHRCFDVLVGTEPIGNPEACKYAIIYSTGHLMIALGHLQQSKLPYNPIDLKEWKKRSFQSRRGERRPIKFTVPVFEIDDTYSLLFHPLSSSHNEDSRRWSKRCDRGGTLISAKSLHVCSLRDIVQGLETIVGGPFSSRDLRVTLRRGNGVDVVVRRKRVAGTMGFDDKYQFTIEDRVDTQET